MKKSYWIIIVLILIGGFYRLYDLGHDSYWIDESYTVLSAKNIGTYGVPQFDSGVHYNRALLQEYSLFVIGLIFGYGHVAMRILSALAGTLLIFIVFMFVRRYHDEITALIAAGLITFSYFMIAWSRQARMYIFVALFAVLAVYYYFAFLEKKRGRDLLFMLLFLIIGYTFNPIIAVVLLGIVIHYFIVRGKKAVIDLKKLYLSNKIVFTFVSLILIAAFVYFIVGFLLSLTFEKNYLNAYQYFLLSSQYYILFFAVIGLFSVKKMFNRNLFYLLTIFIAFISASFVISDLNFRYLFIAMPFLLVLASEGIVYLFGIYESRLYKIGVIIVIAAVFIVSGYAFLPQNSYALERGTPQPPFEDAYNFVKNIEGNYTLIVTQPAIAELYFKKADYWLAIPYENKGLEYLYNSTTGIEVYSGVQTIDSDDKLLLFNNSIIVIDDMGLDRLNSSTRDIVMNYTLLARYGTNYWNVAYIYGNIY
jgi:4-amino-4-deoxy-L-arabinose transferase-like glycosyltransferase